MSFRQFVGLRISTQPGAVPTAADIAEGELAFNVADGRVFTLFGSTVTDLTDRYTQGEIDTLLAGKANASHTHPWAQVTGKPSTATRWPTFAEVTGKPASYPPSAHSHTLANISDAGSAAAEDASAFDAAGAASSAVTSHEQAADPHAQYAQKADLAAVATSGNYNDLTNKPDLSVLEEVTVYTDLASFPASGETDKIYIAQDSGYMYRWSGSGYVQLTDQTAIWGQISGNLANQNDLRNALAAKVDKVAGKGLSANDYTDAEQSKLSGIESGATADQTGAEIKSLYEAEPNTNAFTDSEKSKLSAVGTMANRDVYISDQPPDNQVGQDGDIWLQHWS